MAGQAGTVGTPPAHYAGDGVITPFAVIDAYKMGFHDGNALKYLARWDKKGSPLGDLKKALHYIEETLIRLERGDTWAVTLAPPLGMEPVAVAEAFGFRHGHVFEAIFYLLCARTTGNSGADLRAAVRYVQGAIEEQERA